MDFKFLYNNILHPEGKIEVKLGSTDLAKGYYKNFNKRSPQKAFLKNKKFNCAIIQLHNFISENEYINSVKGKNSADYFSRRCEKLGYTFKSFDPNEHIDEIYEIHLSASERQGREMDASYLLKVDNWPSNDENTWYGVFDKEGKLVAYLWLVILNDLALINRILGHKDHLNNNVMYLGTLKTIVTEIKINQRKVIMYDTFGSKKNGLVLFKKRLGFKVFTINFKLG